MAETVHDVEMRVVVIESIPLVLSGLRSALEGDGISVVAGTHDAQAGVRIQALHLTPP